MDVAIYNRKYPYIFKNYGGVPTKILNASSNYPVVMVVHYLVSLGIDLLCSEQKQLTFHNNACFVLFLFLFLVYMFHISLFSLRLAHFSYGFLCSLFSSRSRSRLHSLKDMWKHYCYDWSLFRICHVLIWSTPMGHIHGLK